MVNETLRYVAGLIQKPRFLVHSLLFIFAIILAVIFIIAIVNRWFDKDLILNIGLTILGTFAGAGLLKYAKQK